MADGPETWTSMEDAMPTSGQADVHIATLRVLYATLHRDIAKLEQTVERLRETVQAHRADMTLSLNELHKREDQQEGGLKVIHMVVLGIFAAPGWIALLVPLFR